MQCVIIHIIFLAMVISFAGCGGPLYRAAWQGDVTKVNTLLENKTKDEIDEEKVLVAAARGGNSDIVTILIEKGADVNVLEGTGWTPLFAATYFGHANIVRILLDAGAEIREDDLKLAQSRGHTMIANMLERASEERYIVSKKPAYSAPSKVAATAALTAPFSATPADSMVASLNFGSYHALVIGNNDYQRLPKLRTAVNDAKSMAEVLRAKYGYEVELLLNATRSEIFKAIYSYRRTLTSRDNLLIYYAGHGWLDKEADEGYWLPVDAGRQDPANWISNSSITSSLRAMKAKHVLVVADSCYSGKLARGISIRVRSGDYYQRISMKKARTVLASGGLEPVADDGGKGNHSVFASAIIEALNENQGVLDATLLFSKIRRPVMVNADQTPEYSDIRKAGHDGGDFLFVPR
jgi:predicted small lipoprotein YifL